MKRLILTTGAVSIAYGALYLHPSAKPPAPSDWIDVALVSGFAVGLTLASLVMIVGTRKWSGRQLGVFWTTVAGAMIWSGALWVRVLTEGTPFIVDGTVVTLGANGQVLVRGKPVMIPHQQPEWYTDILRACLIVGIPLFVMGILVWVKARIKQATPEDVIEHRDAEEIESRLLLVDEATQ